MSDKNRSYDRYTDLLTIGAGGFFGAMSRYLLAGQFHAVSGTLVVNVLGSILLGFLMYNSEYLGYVNPKTKMFFGIGFLGSFTTFSTFAVQTFQMSTTGAILNISFNMALSIAGVFAGRGIVVYIVKMRGRSNGF
ncbi:fluoride efflux transporter CrcB [Methanolobus sp. ZRKC3]|uniref:fluoride efflux transporter CrcB n=1 Tax=Methanolobus sp. ZRKC3 TaxID=3125786 RepID=UPI003253505E